MNNFVYFGTPSVASDTLAHLLENGFTPKLVVTSPDAPRGRGLVLTPSPTKTLALENNLPVITPEKLDKETIAEIVATGADLGICVAYGKIFPEELINAFRGGVLNVHYSLLPRHRGATPLEAALLAGDQMTGVTIQKMVKALDAGDIVAQTEIPVEVSDTARELRPKLINLGATLLTKTLPGYIAGEISPVAQDHSLATHAGKLKKEDGLIDLSAPAESNWNKYRAYADTIGTYFVRSEKRVKIIEAQFTDDVFTPTRVVPEGKQAISYKDFLQRS